MKTALCYLALLGGAWCAADMPAQTKLIVLLITADDMNYDSPGFTGCRVPDITPNLDRLAAEAMWFQHAHVTVAVCQPDIRRKPHRSC